MFIEMDLDWLEYNGHTVDRNAVTLADGRDYFKIDGKAVGLRRGIEPQPTIQPNAFEFLGVFRERPAMPNAMEFLHIVQPK